MPEALVVQAVALAPGGVADLFGLQFADIGGGAEEEAEVEVVVGGLVAHSRGALGHECR